MKFTTICLITDDVLSLGQFYQQALNVKTEGDHTFMRVLVDGAGFTICSQGIMEGMSPGSTGNMGHGGSVIEIEVEDVDTEYERLLRLPARVIKPPTTQEWGIRSVWFSDPDGNIINFHARV